MRSVLISELEMTQRQSISDLHEVDGGRDDKCGGRLTSGLRVARA